MKPNERIWLQSDEEHGEPTWCEDKINDDDVEYIRADVYAQLETENERLRDERDQWKERYEILATDAARRSRRW